MGSDELTGGHGQGAMEIDGRRPFPDVVEVIVEIPRGSRNKYEWNEHTGTIWLDRVLSSAVFYNFDYSFVEDTRAEDGDHTDALLLVSEPVHPVVHVWARPVGGLEMADEHGFDFKVLCVALGDPLYAHVAGLEDISPHRLTEIEHFFATYKLLEDKKVNVVGWRGLDRAIEVLRADRERYLRETLSGSAAAVDEHGGALTRSVAADPSAVARLNENQRRAIAVSLRLLEERLATIDDLLERDEQGALYRRVRPAATPEQSVRLAALTAETRDAIRAAAQAFELPEEGRDAKSAILALLAMSWQTLGEIDSRGMRAYGDVDAALPRILDPTVQRLMDLVLALETAVRSLPAAAP